MSPRTHRTKSLALILALLTITFSWLGWRAQAGRMLFADSAITAPSSSGAPLWQRMLKRAKPSFNLSEAKSSTTHRLAAMKSPAILFASPNIVISQVYGGGGNTGATYKNDFIELYNRGASSVSVTGWSVQYASATGTSWQVTNLSGTIPAGGYYLVQMAQGAGGTTNLPTPDATGTIAMNATAGKVALVNSTIAMTGSGCPFAASVVDFVGFGSTTDCFEGTAPTPAPSNTTGVRRAANGCIDTDVNSSDFTTAAPTPRNSAAPLNSCLTINDVSLNEGNAGTTSFTFTAQSFRFCPHRWRDFRHCDC